MTVMIFIQAHIICLNEKPEVTIKSGNKIVTEKILRIHLHYDRRCDLKLGTKLQRIQSQKCYICRMIQPNCPKQYCYGGGYILLHFVRL